MPTTPSPRAVAVAEALAEQLERGGTASLRVASGSMAPLARPGDVIEVRRVPVERLAPGDLVVVASGGSMIVHRLLGRRPAPQGWLLVTKGDRHLRPDAPWEARHYLGRAEAIHGSRGRIDLRGLRWRAANRLSGALAQVEIALLSAVGGARPGGRPLGRGLRWLLRAARAPGRGLVALNLLTTWRRSVTTAEQRREFLYACLRNDGPAAERYCRAWRMADQAWAELLREGERCKLLPLLHRCLRRRSAQLPAWFSQEVASAYLRSHAYNLNLRTNLEVLLRAFNAEGIAVVLLKGAALLAQEDSLEDARPTADLDLLVREDDRERAGRALATLGYGVIHHTDVISRQEAKATTWINQERRVVVDLHSHLLLHTSLFTMDMEALWRQTQPVTVGSEPALTLRPEPALLYAALHGMWLHGSSLGQKWLYDMALILKSRQGEFDWAEFLRRSREWRAGRAAYWPLRLAHEFLGAPVPAEALDRLRPGRLRRWAARRLLRRLDILPGRSVAPAAGDRLALALFWQLTIGPGITWRRRLRVALQQLLPATLIGIRGHEPSPLSVAAALLGYLRPSRLRRGVRVLSRSLIR